MNTKTVAPEGPDTLRQRLIDNADYMEGRHGGPPATIATDSDLWRTTIQLQRDAASALAPTPQPALNLLRELVTLVRGECPSLLNEDSGGDARLSLAIDAALASPPEHAKRTKILRASEQPAASGSTGSPRSSQPGGSEQ